MGLLDSIKQKAKKFLGINEPGLGKLGETIKSIAKTAPSLITPGGITRAIATRPKVSKAAAKLAVSPVTFAGRAATKVALEPAAGIISLAKGKKVDPVFKPKTKFEQAVFGKEPVKGIFQETREVQAPVKSYLQRLGFSKDTATGLSLGIAPLFVGGMAGLDLTPIGGGKKQVGKAAAKKLKKINPKDILDASKDFVYKELKKVKKAGIKVPLEYFEVAQEISKKIESGKATMRDVNRGQEIIKLSKLRAPKEMLGLGAGIEVDETGSVKFAPEKAALGFLGIKGIKKLPGTLNKLNISADAKRGLQETIAQIKPELQKIKGGVLKNKDVVEAAKSSSILTRMTTKEATKQSEAVLLRTRQHLAELAKTKTITPEFLDSLKVVSAEATKRGRELQALGIKADPALGSIKTKLVKELLKIGKSSDDILKASKGVDFTNAKQVADFYRKFVKPGLPELLDEYRYINLLSSPRTHIVNAFSNMLQVGFLRPTTRLASGLIDNVGSKLTGKEQQYYLRQVPAYYKGAINSFGDATSGFLKAFRGESIIYRPDIRQIPTGNKFLRPFQVVPRMLEGSDVFFRTLATGGELEALMSKGVPKALAMDKAAKTAEELVFRKALDPSNKAGQGLLLSGIDKLTTAIYKLRNVPSVKWFIPFVQTPMNILKQGIEYSPLGAATLPGNINKIEQLGKAMVGSSVFGGAAWLAMNDRTTWGAPTNKKEKDAFYAAGMQPYSVKIGDKWVSYSKLGPLAYPMAMAAALKYHTQENPKAVTDTKLEKITKVIRGVAEFFADQSYVSGLGDFVDMAKGDTVALTRAASNIPSQLIPLVSLQRWVANIIDPIYRKTDTKLSAKGIINNLRKGIPFASKGVEPHTTPTGEESKRQFPLIQSFSPLGVTKEDPEFSEHFERLKESRREKLLDTESREELKTDAVRYYDQLKAMPKSRAADEFDALIKEEPDLAKEIIKLVEDEQLGRNFKDDFYLGLGVTNGARAKAIKHDLDKLGTKEEKAAFYDELINKKVITKNVNEQLLKLLETK